MTAVMENPVVAEAESVEGPVAPVVNSMTAHELFTAVSDAVLFTAAPSAMIPALEAVRLEFGDGQLVAAATDRFTLGVSRVAYSGASATVMIAGGEAKALVKMAKTLKRDEKSREVTVEFAGERQVTFRFSTGEAMTVHGLDVEFPKWRQLVPADTSRMGGIVGMGYDPTLIGRFAKVRRDEHGPGAEMVVFPSVSSQGRPGPTVIRIGEGFIGLLMPKRPAGNEWGYQRPGWLDEAASVAVSGAEDGR